MRNILFMYVLLAAIGCSTKKTIISYKTGMLEIEELTKATYIHRSFLETDSWGKVACNGLVYVNEGQAVIFDTPTNNQASSELINWVENELHAKVTAVVVNHFHNDCLGGLSSFHDRGIASYASIRTQNLARADNVNKPLIPKNGFEVELSLPVGNKKVINRFFGEGHTRDNIVSYIPTERVMFGGCLIKEMGAGKGNLADANVKEWSNSVTNVKKMFPGARLVVPGHGKAGDMRLLDYTIQLFSTKTEAVKPE